MADGIFFFKLFFNGLIGFFQRRSDGEGFLNHKAFRSAWAGVQEGLAEDVILLRGQGGEKADEGLQLPGSLLVAGIGAEYQDTAGKEQAKGLVHGGEGGLEAGGDGVIATGQPSKVEYDQTHRGWDGVGHVFVAEMEQESAVRKAG